MAVDVAAVIVFMILFENYWEGAAIALVADSFYSLPGSYFTYQIRFLHPCRSC